MLRLYSMFPAGAPGIALLLLRVSVAVAMLEGCPHFLKPSIGPMISTVVAAQALLLCIGYMTPAVSVVACMFELVSLLVAAHTDIRFIVLTSLNAAAIALLGPGAYSLDARLFGRREIVFRPDGRPGRH